MLRSVIMRATAALVITGALIAQTDDDVVVETPLDTPPHPTGETAPSNILDEATTDEEIDTIATTPTPSQPQPSAPKADQPTPPPTTTKPTPSSAKPAPTPGTREHAIHTALQQATPQDNFSAESDQHVVSQSRMFSVSGGDSLRMGAIATKADEVRGQVVKASIVLTKGTEGTEELKKEIQDYVKKRTAPYKYPRIVEFRKELPKTISGKIQRNKL